MKLHFSFISVVFIFMSSHIHAMHIDHIRHISANILPENCLEKLLFASIPLYGFSDATHTNRLEIDKFVFPSFVMYLVQCSEL